MEMTIKSTSKILTINGVEARLWEGVSAHGTPVHALIARIGIAPGTAVDLSEFQQELQECAPPSPELENFPETLKLPPISA